MVTVRQWRRSSSTVTEGSQHAYGTTATVHSRLRFAIMRANSDLSNHFFACQRQGRCPQSLWRRDGGFSTETCSTVQLASYLAHTCVLVTRHAESGESFLKQGLCSYCLGGEAEYCISPVLSVTWQTVDLDIWDVMRHVSMSKSITTGWVSFFGRRFEQADKRKIGGETGLKGTI